MARYKLINGQNGTPVSVLDRDRSTSIPFVVGNRDYHDYLLWLEEGNTPDPADPPPVYKQGVTGVSAQGRTTNATPFELFRRPLAQLTAYAAEFKLVGIDAGNGVLRRIRADVLAKRLNGGAVLEGTAVISNIQTAPGAPATASGVSNWAITASVSGNDFIITVTGSAGRTVDWLLSGTVERFAPGGLGD